LLFGSGNFDLRIYHDATDSRIENNTGDLYIINYTDNKDIIFQSDDGSGGVETYFYLDGSIDGGNPFTVFPDNARLSFGTNLDLRFTHDGSNSYIEQTGTGDLYIQQHNDDKDIVFQSDDASGGVTEYFRLDGSEAQSIFTRSVKLLDGVRLKVGTGADLNIYHDGVGVSSRIENETGPLYITNKANDADIYFQSDDGSGALLTYFYLDGSLADGTNTYTIFPDNRRLRFGSDLDLDIHHDGSNSFISQTGTGNLHIQQTVDDGDIIFKCDDGSGGTTQYFRLDGGRADLTVSKSVRLLDGVQLQFGDDVDMNIMHNGANGFITNAKGDLTIKSSEADKDIIFQADNGSGGGNVTTYFRCDGSYGGPGFPTTIFPNDASCRFGNSGELQIIRTSGHSYISNNASGNLYIRNASANEDIVFEADNGAGSGNVETYFFCDGSRSTGNPYTLFPDNSHLAFGSDADFQMVHSGTTMAITNKEGDLYIVNEKPDKDIIFQADDGSGLVETYFFLDGSKSTGNPYTIFPNSSFLGFGNDGNLLINHGGSSGSATIQNNGGDINITQNTNNGDVTFFNDDGSGSTAMYLSLDGGREIVKHHRGVEYNVTSVSNSDHTVTSSDYFILYTAVGYGNAITIPDAQKNAGRVLIIKAVDAGSNSLNINPAGSVTIDGSTTLDLTTNNACLTIVCDGSNWHIVSKHN
jgi:hypothetical protein